MIPGPPPSTGSTTPSDPDIESAATEAPRPAPASESSICDPASTAPGPSPEPASPAPAEHRFVALFAPAASLAHRLEALAALPLAPRLIRRSMAAADAGEQALDLRSPPTTLHLHWQPAAGRFALAPGDEHLVCGLQHEPADPEHPEHLEPTASHERAMFVLVFLALLTPVLALPAVVAGVGVPLAAGVLAQMVLARAWRWVLAPAARVLWLVLWLLAWPLVWVLGWVLWVVGRAVLLLLPRRVRKVLGWCWGWIPAARAEESPGTDADNVS